MSLYTAQRPQQWPNNPDYSAILQGFQATALNDTLEVLHNSTRAGPIGLMLTLMRQEWTVSNGPAGFGLKRCQLAPCARPSLHDILATHTPLNESVCFVEEHLSIDPQLEIN